MTDERDVVGETWGGDMGDMGSDFYIPTVSERLLQEMTRLARIVES